VGFAGVDVFLAYYIAAQRIADWAKKLAKDAE
jgi:hypothetical protein